MIKNISIKNKFQYSLLLLTSLLVLIIIMSTYFLNQVKQQAEKLYNHPYTVTNTIKDIESDIQSLFSDMQILVQPQNQPNSDTIIEDITSVESDIENSIDVLYERYLGDMDDIISLEEKYSASKVKRDNVIEYVEALNYQDAQDELALGIQSKQLILDDIQVIIDFAENKAIEMDNEADRLATLYLQIVVFSSVSVILITFVIVLMTLRDITPPLNKLIYTINSHRQGEDDTDLITDRGDELGVIARNLKEMLDNIKTTGEIRELSLKLENLRDKENLRITLMSIGDGVITTNLNGEVTNINPSASRMTGFTPIEAVGRNILEVFKIIDKETRLPNKNPIQTVIKKGAIKGLSNHTVLISRDGFEFDISESAAPILDENGKKVGVVLVFRDVTEQYKKQEEIEYLSYHDQLTGLFNRNQLEKEMRKYQELNTKNVAIIMGDVNGLKIANDAFGHKFGDQLLIEVSNILRMSVPKESVITRWGGDEFVIMLKGMNDQKLSAICHKIRDLCNEYDSDAPFRPSISLGYAIKTTTDQNLYRTLILAEDMMYENKLLEKNSLRSEIVNGIQKSLFEKSYETEEHANRVAKYGELIARGLKLNDNEINKVVLLSKLHDIGKISIEDALLTKQGKLNQDEWKTMKKHPETGYRIATSLSELAHIADGILAHHEHYDGKGYPRGIKGKDIPLYARIISVADAFDVMTSERAYKKTMTISESIEELYRCKGTQFDPELVDIFVAELQKQQ